jgi:hypothetical protein
MAGTLTIDTLKASSGVLATQNGMTGIAKAWVNYNAVTQTIRSSFNVSSVTYLATGKFQVNFSTAMPNANYGFAFGQQPAGDYAFSSKVDYNQTYTTTYIQITTGQPASANDATTGSVVIFA